MTEPLDHESGSTTARMHAEDSSGSEQYWSADEGPGGEDQRKSGGNRGWVSVGRLGIELCSGGGGGGGFDHFAS